MKVGVALFVILSVLEEPLSVAAVMSGVPGAAGAAVSMVIARAGPCADVPPELVKVLVTVWLPSVVAFVGVIL